MFIKSQDESSIIEITGTVKINNPVISGCYNVVMCNKLGYYILGEYSTLDYAKNALNAIALAIAVGVNLFIMPEKEFTEEKLIAKMKDIKKTSMAA